MEFKILSLFNWQIMLLIAISVSILVEALNLATPKWLSKRKLLAIASFVITLLKVPLDFGNIELIQLFIFNVLLYMAFAMLFYELVGKYTITKIFDFIGRKINKETEVTG